MAEPWYQHHEACLTHPLVYCPTILSSQLNTTPSQEPKYFGIYLLVKSHRHSLIQSTNSSQYSIAVSPPGFHFAGVYYPPYSLSDHNLKPNLKQIRPIDLLLGNINTTFQPNRSIPNSFNSSLTSCSILFHTWAINIRIVHILDIAQNLISDRIPDYAFEMTQSWPHITLWLVSTHLLFFHTDHRFLLQIHYDNIWAYRITTTAPCSTSTYPSGPLWFHVQPLWRPEIAQ